MIRYVEMKSVVDFRIYELCRSNESNIIPKMKQDKNIEYTIEDIKIKGVDIETSIVVVVKEMSGGINLGTSMGGKFHLRRVSDGAILYALSQPNHLTDTIGRAKRRHIGGNTMGNVDDPPIIVSISMWDQVVGVGKTA